MLCDDDDEVEFIYFFIIFTHGSSSMTWEQYRSRATSKRAKLSLIMTTIFTDLFQMSGVTHPHVFLSHICLTHNPIPFSIYPPTWPMCGVCDWHIVRVYLDEPCTTHHLFS